MRIVVSQIPDLGQDVTIEGAWAEKAARTALDAAPRTVGGALRLERQEDGKVTVSGHVSAAADRVCERCGEDTGVVVEIDVDLVYAPVPPEFTRVGADGKDAEEQADEDDDVEEPDLDDGFYANDALELADVVCEAIALELDPRVVCDDAAACDRRTADLLASKGTSGTAGHPAFAKLKPLG